MPPRIPFLPPSRVPLQGLLDHYETAAKSVTVIDEALRGYLASGASRAFVALMAEMDALEAEADKIKRRVRNHLPSPWRMPVDRTLLLNYTRSQDNILDAAQEALVWLGMRPMALPEKYQADLMAMAAASAEAVTGLKPALQAAVGLIMGERSDRQSVKDLIQNVRDLHLKTGKAKRQTVSDAYCSDMEFKDVYQVIHVVDELTRMSHNAEGCADTLRAMLAR